MHRILILFLLGNFLLGCRADHNGIRIRGSIKGIPDGKIYVTDGYGWNTVFIDSTTIQNGFFSFDIQPTSDFIPHLVSITYYKNGRIERLQFAGISHKSPDGRIYNGTSCFMLEQGLIELSGDIKNYSICDFSSLGEGHVEVKGGPQSDAYFRTSEMDGLTKDDSKETTQRDASIISRFPYSYWLLEVLEQNETSYSNAHLLELSGLFNKTLQNSVIVGRIKAFVNHRNPSDLAATIRIYRFQDSLGNPATINPGDSGLTLVIFWASWCGPCRQEIPELKEIYQKYSRRINMVGISIDQKRALWLGAIGELKIPWRDLWVGEGRMDSVFSAFSFSQIPYVLLLNNKNGVLYKTVGYSPGGLEPIIKLNMGDL